MDKATIKIIKRVITVLIFAVVILVGYSMCSKSCAATVNGVVNDPDGVMMRTAPSRSADIIYVLEHNTRVEIAGETTGDGLRWYKVIYNGRTGYSAADYITKEDNTGGSGGSGNIDKDFTNTYGTVNAKEGLNVRTGPGAGYGFMGLLDYGAQVKVNGQKPDHNGEIWYEIIYAGKTGYVKGEFLDLFEIPPYVPEANFEEHLTAQGFPESYKVLLRKIHAQYPNWVFVSGKTKFNWEDAVSREYRFIGGKRINTIHDSFPDSWKSMEDGDYNFNTKTYKSYDSGYYVAASPTLIRYCMDPRNFLNATDVFQFVSSKFNSSIHTASGLQAMLNGTFMAGAVSDPSYKTYNGILMEAARSSQVSPYTLAAMILQEQGRDGVGGCISGTEPGFEGLYNFFNIGAYSSGGYNAVQNGLIYAREQGWTTRSKSIIAGAKWYSENYVNNGQHTQYLKKFNVMNGLSQVGEGQYMTNVIGAYQEAGNLKNAYNASLNEALVFEIPVYENMPADACPKPGNTGNNNNFVDSISINGKIVSSFNRFTYNYIVDAKDATSVTLQAKANEPNAKVEGVGTKTLKKGENKFDITVTATSGEKRVYTVIINTQGEGSYSLELLQKPFRTDYVYGDKDLDLTGAKIKISYSDGKDEIINVSKQMISDYNLNKIGTQRINIIYKGKTVGFDINVAPADISNKTVKLEYESVKYDGQAKEPMVTIDNLVQGIDFDVTYTNNINQGTATIVIKGKNHYQGTVYKTFEITQGDILGDIFIEGNISRLYGSYRYETAVKAANLLKKQLGVQKFSCIVVACGTNYPDALSGSYLAIQKNAPILLVGNGYEDYIAEYINNNLESNGEVFLLGGTGVVSEYFRNKINTTNVVRLGGIDRYETNIQILNYVGIKGNELLVCTGNNFADSLSAAQTGKAIFLVDNKIRESQKGFLESSNFNYYIIGGEGVVSSQIANELSSTGRIVKRIGGIDRYETSVAVTETFTTCTNRTVVMAYGENFPDGLVGGVVSYFIKTPMILVSDYDMIYAKEYADKFFVDKSIVFGGPLVISDKTIQYVIQ